MKKKLISLLLTGAMVASLSACGGGVYEKEDAPAEESTATEAEAAPEGSEVASGQKVFRYYVSTEPTTLDPTKGNSIGDNELNHADTESLVRTMAGQVQPGLAETWDISDDGLTYTFHLRDGIKWSDGQDIVAGDFVYSFQRLMDPATASIYAFIGESIKNGAAVEAGEVAPTELGISAPDDKTVVIELEAPTAYFLSMLGAQGQFAPLRQDIVEQYGEEFAATWDKNVYSGPWKMVSSEGNVYAFEPNEYYWNKDAVKMDRVECTVVADPSTALAMYEEGSLDYVGIPNEQVANYVDDARHHEYMNGNEDYLYINCGSEDQPLLGDKNFRLALNYALDRNTYIALTSNNVYKPANTLVMPLVNGVEKAYGEEYDVASESYPMEGDVEKAKEYLKAAMDAAGITDASTIELEFVTTDAEVNKKIAEVCQELWQNALGIKVNIRQVTYGEIYGTVYPTSDYQVGYAGWGPDYSDPYTYLGLFEGSFDSYGTNYQNDKVDELLAAAKTETDAKARMDMLNEAEKLILEDGAFVPLQCRQAHYLLDEDVTGVEFYFCSVNIDWAFADCAAAE